MQVMTNHKWHDTDIQQVAFYRDGLRDIELKDNTHTVVFNERDVIALAKEFGLVVYRKDAAL